MTFIRSISGFRGTIGGAEYDNLTPPDVVRSTVGYGSWILDGFAPREGRSRPLIVVGRDARPSGDMVQRLVTGTLMGMGIDILDLGLSTTPTVEMAVAGEGADGGIILTASHNPVHTCISSIVPVTATVARSLMRGDSDRCFGFSGQSGDGRRRMPRGPLGDDVSTALLPDDRCFPPAFSSLGRCRTPPAHSKRA